MYLFGTENPAIQWDQAAIDALLATARSHVANLANTPMERIVTLLDRLGQTWLEGSPNWQQAYELTRHEVPFSEAMLKYSLAIIPELLRAGNVRARLQGDFRNPKVLDEFVSSHSFKGRERAFPLGVLLHVSAGNVFLGAIDSLLMGFLSKNVSVVKLSSRNLNFPLLFARSLQAVDVDGVLADKFALMQFAGGSSEIESALMRGVNGVMAWGGEDMISAYKRIVPMGVRFIEYGPKVSFQVVSKQALARLGYAAAGQRIATDVSMWDQAACASPQNLFFEDGIDIAALLDATAQAFASFALARGQLSDDEHVEILKEKHRANYSRIMASGASRDGDDYFLHFDPSPGLRPSPLNRTLIFKSFTGMEDLVQQLRPFARFLQSCGYLCDESERDHWLSTLGTAGVMRFTPLGQVMQAPIGAPHDGRMSLLELTRLVPDERDNTVLGQVNDAIRNVPFYAERAQQRALAQLDELGTISGKDMQAGSAAALAHYVRADTENGYIFSSGGTSGAPKYSLYSHDEFDDTAKLLAIGFAAQGVAKGDMVANLFVAGNMWSSFLVVDRALRQLQCRTLPIGGLTAQDATLGYFAQFQPRVLVGLPTTLLELARRARELNQTFAIDTVLYAGEHLSLMAREFIKNVFGTRHFGSAGYASVDAGPIGYQCRHCEGGIHHLFADDVHLEVIQGEAVVTSLIKRQMPVIRLRTGDLVDWVTGDACPCGATDPRFRLLGRSDSQFNVWGCRMFLEEVERALDDLGLDGCLFQIVLQNSSDARETLLLRLETSDGRQVAAESFIGAFYQRSKDLKASVSEAWLQDKISIDNLAQGGIVRVERTGKIKLLLDER
jgi:phenylacetate-coenzyme A ligase PaaK-like adenylate-forming protein